MEDVMSFVKGFNIQTIISVFLMLWYFVNHIESKIEKQSEKSDQINSRLDIHMSQINQRADDLHREFYELLKEMRK